MRGLEINYMERGHTNIYIHTHRDLLTNSANRAELVKLIKIGSGLYVKINSEL